MADDEEVIFESSPLFQYLTSSGYDSNEFLAQEKYSNSNSEEELKGNVKNIKIPFPIWLKNSIKNYIYDESWIKEIKTLHSRNCNKIVEQSLKNSYISEDDANYIESFSSSLTISENVNNNLTNRFDNENDDFELDNKSLNIEVSIWPQMFTQICVLCISIGYGLIRMFNLKSTSSNSLSFYNWIAIYIIDFLSIFMTICALLPTAFRFAGVGQLVEKLSLHNTNFDCILQKMDTYMRLCSKALLFIQESEVIDKGYTLVTAPVSRLECGLRSQEVRLHPDLRRQIIKCTKEVLIAIRFANCQLIEEFPKEASLYCMENSMSKIDLQHFGEFLSDIDDEKLKRLTDNYSLASIKILIDLTNGHFSEFLKLICLSSLVDTNEIALNKNLENLGFTKQSKVIEIFKVSISNQIKPLNFSLKMHNSLKTRIVNQNKQNKNYHIRHSNKKFDKLKLNGVGVALHSLKLHLENIHLRILSHENKIVLESQINESTDDLMVSENCPRIIYIKNNEECKITKTSYSYIRKLFNYICFNILSLKKLPSNSNIITGENEQIELKLNDIDGSDNIKTELNCDKIDIINDLNKDLEFLSKSLISSKDCFDELTLQITNILNISGDLKNSNKTNNTRIGDLRKNESHLLIDDINVPILSSDSVLIVEDEVFEGFSKPMPKNKKQNVDCNEEEFKTIEKETQLVLGELKSVIAIRAKETEERENKAVLKKKQLEEKLNDCASENNTYPNNNEVFDRDNLHFFESVSNSNVNIKRNYGDINEIKDNNSIINYNSNENHNSIFGKKNESFKRSNLDFLSDNQNNENVEKEQLQINLKCSNFNLQIYNCESKNEPLFTSLTTSMASSAANLSKKLNLGVEEIYGNENDSEDDCQNDGCHQNMNIKTNNNISKKCVKNVLIDKSEIINIKENKLSNKVKIRKEENIEFENLYGKIDLKNFNENACPMSMNIYDEFSSLNIFKDVINSDNSCIKESLMFNKNSNHENCKIIEHQSNFVDKTYVDEYLLENANNFEDDDDLSFYADINCRDDILVLEDYVNYDDKNSYKEKLISVNKSEEKYKKENGTFIKPGGGLRKRKKNKDNKDTPNLNNDNGYLIRKTDYNQKAFVYNENNQKSTEEELAFDSIVTNLKLQSDYPLKRFNNPRKYNFKRKNIEMQKNNTSSDENFDVGFNNKSNKINNLMGKSSYNESYMDQYVNNSNHDNNNENNICCQNSSPVYPSSHIKYKENNNSQSTNSLFFINDILNSNNPSSSAERQINKNYSVDENRQDVNNIDYLLLQEQHIPNNFNIIKNNNDESESDSYSSSSNYLNLNNLTDDQYDETENSSSSAAYSNSDTESEN